MVRALLAGRKTQTRRIVKRNPAGRVQFGGRNWHLDDPNAVRACPYGQPGDLLYVREAWRTSVCVDGKPAGVLETPGEGYGWPIWYSADDGTVTWRGSISGGHGFTTPGRYRHARFMPRWASRLTLRITDVGVERLQSISGMDAKREGAPVPAHIPEDGADLEWARGWYRLLWDDINGDGAWDANPWVWAISFDVIHANVDTVANEKVAA